jgi:type IV pilus assembly protein PilE
MSDRLFTIFFGNLRMNSKLHRVSPLRRGFTLIELMIVVAIIAILASIALPNYTEYVRKANRAEARTQILKAAQFMQRFYASNDRFDTDRAAVAVALPSVLQQSPEQGTALYNLAVESTASAYTLTATPVTGGSMAADTCGNLILNHTNLKSVSGSSTAVQCWK